MVARSPHEAHRAATPLELFFDLVFVVAIAQAASGLHHAVAELHALDGLLGYLMVFFAIWWAWMAFTWFASAYDCDDVPYRLLVFVQIAGALLMAAGITSMFETRMPNIATVGGYVIMRLALVVQWLRASASDPTRRTTARRYALGITILQTAWAGMLLVPQYWTAGIPHSGCAGSLGTDVGGAIVADDVASASHRGAIRPVDADRAGRVDPVGERGDSVSACGRRCSLRTDADHRRRAAHRVRVVVGLLRSAGSRSAHEHAEGLRLGIRPLLRLRISRRGWCGARGRPLMRPLITAKIGPVGAGVAVADARGDRICSCLWFLHHRPEYRRTRAYGPVAAVLVLLTPFTGMGCR